MPSCSAKLLMLRANRQWVDVDISNAFNYVGTSTDGSVVLFESPGQLVEEGASTKGLNIYIWDRDTGELKLAGVLNNGSAPVKGALAGSNAVIGSDYSRHYTQAEHAVSSDGSRVFFSDIGSGQLYVRENPTEPQSALAGEHCTETALACTVKSPPLSAPFPIPKLKNHSSLLPPPTAGPRSSPVKASSPMTPILVPMT